MIKKLLRSIIQISKWSLLVLSILPVSTAHASAYTVTGAQDFYFTINEPTVFTVRTYAWDSGHIDSMIWLYGPDGNLVTQNDDFYGLDSHISVNIVGNGTYRLRTGVCCGDPNRWYGESYTIEVNTDVFTNPETTTTWPETTTSTTTTTTSTTTVPPTTVPVTEPPTTVGTTTTTTTEPPTTTTSSTTSLPPVIETTLPPVETTVTSVAPTTSTIGTTVAPTVAPSTVVTTTTSAPIVVTPPPVSSTSTTTTVASTSTSTSIPESTSSSTSTTTTTTVPVENGPQISKDEIANLSSEELNNLVESIDVSSLTEESISAVFSEDVLSELSDDQVSTLIDSISPSDLTEEQAQALSESLTNAPDNVKQEFESQINVFGGQFDTYVPTGSVISVGARRVVVAAAAASFAMPTPTSARKRK